MNKMNHMCPDKTIYEWIPRVPQPRNCPRCKGRLNKQPKEKDVDPAPRLEKQELERVS